MEKILVIDANVLVSALIKGEFTLRLIYSLKNITNSPVRK